MNWLICVSSVIFIFGLCHCSIHTYGSQFYGKYKTGRCSQSRMIDQIPLLLGHELLFKEVILNASSVAPQNYTTVFNYDDQDLQIVTFAKFQIDGVSLIRVNKFPRIQYDCLTSDELDCYVEFHWINVRDLTSKQNKNLVLHRKTNL